MSIDACPFCEHSNPTDAKFCNACGGALHLRPCLRCGAVNDVTATTCYQCHDPLLGRGTSALDNPQPAGELPRALPRPHARVIAGAALFFVIAIVSYVSYRQASHLSASQPPDASGEVEVRSTAGGAGVSPQNAMAGGMTSGKRDASTQPVSAAAAQAVIPVAGAAPAAAIQPRESRQSLESRAASVTTAPNARTKATREGGVGERVSPRVQECTEAVAALGFCTLKSDQKKGAGATMTIKPVITHTKAGTADTAGEPKARRWEACTDEAMALGLCTPRPTQEGK